MAAKKILIIEDNKDIHGILKKRLEDTGFSVDIAEGGYAALGHLKDDKGPAAVILDLMLPERSGMELLTSLNSRWPEAKIFIFTAHEEYRHKTHMFGECVSAFFCKTDGLDRLIDAVKSALADERS